MIAITFLFTALFTDNVLCQFKNIGLKGGINISNAKIVTSYTGDNLTYPSGNEIGFNAILFYDFLNLKHFGLSIELGYSKRGFSEDVIESNEFGIETGRFNISNKLEYIDFAFLGNYMIHYHSVSPYISGGPVLAFYQGYSSDATIDRNQNFIFGENNIRLSKLDKTTVGIKIGAGVEITNIIPQSLIFEIRYYTDLEGNYSLQSFKKNIMLEINGGIKF